MSAGAISKAEYLKRYTSGDTNGDITAKRHKQKKPKKSDGHRKRLLLIDHDVNVPVKSPPKVNRGQKSTVCDESDNEDGPVLQLTKDLSTEVLKSAAKFKIDSWKSIPSTSTNTAAADSNRRRHDSSDSDSSVTEVPPSGHPRRRHDSHSDVDLSPTRRAGKSDSDESPPRKGGAVSDASDQSPARKARRRRESSTDLTPPRRGTAKADKGSDGDISPPRRGRHNGSAKSRRPRSPERVGKDTRTLDGKAAGLQTAAALRSEADSLRLKQNEAFAKLDDTISGRNAQTVIRDKYTGKRKKPEDVQKEAENARKQAELKEKYEYWNKGVRQVRERADRLEEQSKVAAEPLARYKDDERLDTHLKQQELKEDPMLEYVRKRNMKKHGITQVLPKYSGPAPAPNRFGIWPGYRWDGVDRGTRFEGKLMAARNTTAADEQEAYTYFSSTYE